MSISLSQAQKLSSPNPFCLIGTLREDGLTNLMAVSWWSYATNHPPMVSICINHRSMTYERLQSSGEFTLNMVGAALETAALKCGQCSGRAVSKAEAFGIELAPSDSIKPQCVKNSRIALECRVADSLLAGDHTLYLADVVAIHDNPDCIALYAWDGYASLGPVKGI